MLPDKPTIAILGAGAVGGYYGGRLAQHGHDVHFLVRSDYAALARRGWTIRSCQGDFSIPPHKLRVYNNVSLMPAADLIIITFKTTSNDQYEPLIRPLLKQSTLILTLQNGLGNEERLAELFGAHRVLGGLAFTCINRIEPAVIHHLGQGWIRVGQFVEGQTDLAQAVVNLLTRCRIQADVLPSLRYGRWEKLLWNIPFSGLGGALDLTTDQLIGNRWGLHLVTALMQEVLAAARAHGADIPAGMIDEMIRRTSTMGAYRSSMQIDRQEGRPMEVEAILGEPLRASQRTGVPTPFLAALYPMAVAVNLGKMRKQNP